MRRIGLMGGSFNPVHCGHLNLARAALAAGLADQVLFLPSGNPPHKRAGLADKRDRLAMVELAVAGEPGMGVCREEIDRPGVIYTVDTLTILHGQMPDAELLYLIGADTLAQLGTWRRPDEVIRLCTLLVAARPGEEERGLARLVDCWRGRGARIGLLPAEPMGVSSTAIRARAAAGLSLAGMTPPQVEACIRAHGLYQETEDL